MKYQMSHGINKVLVQVSNQALQNLETGQKTVPSNYKSILEQSVGIKSILLLGITQDGGYNLSSDASLVPSPAGVLKETPFPNLGLSFTIYRVKCLIRHLLRTCAALIDPQ